MSDSTNKLVYVDHKWCLTVNGIQIPNSKIVYDSLKMRNDEFPSVEIMLDQVSIEGVKVGTFHEVEDASA